MRTGGAHRWDRSDLGTPRLDCVVHTRVLFVLVEYDLNVICRNIKGQKGLILRLANQMMSSQKLIGQLEALLTDK